RRRRRCSARWRARSGTAPVVWRARSWPSLPSAEPSRSPEGAQQGRLSVTAQVQVASSSNGAPWASGSSSASGAPVLSLSLAAVPETAAAVPAAAAPAPAAAAPAAAADPELLFVLERVEDPADLLVGERSSISASRTIRRGSYWRGSSLEKSRSAASGPSSSLIVC